MFKMHIYVEKKGKDIVHIFTTFPKGSNKISVKIYVPVYLKFS